MLRVAGAGRSRPPAPPMMIQVSHLTRRYGRTTAVDDLSFEVARGEVAGFLGPNGAGKTTTLRILCGYLAATAGEAIVAGYDVRRDSLEVRRRIGYLPENCPLYPDMRVDEYLRYRAALKGVPARRVRDRVAAVKAQCGIEEVGHRIIGQLSKGYRQRVGMADALVHEPELLILDEPTIGLDPNQILQTRELIRSLGGRHTILLSTHILSEVEAVCGRALILQHGRCIASDATANLRKLRRGRRRVRVELRAPPEELLRALRALPGALAAEETAAEGEGWRRATVDCEEDADPRPAIFRAAVERGWDLREVRLEEQRLEDIFVQLTRDDDAAPAPANAAGTPGAAP